MSREQSSVSGESVDDCGGGYSESIAEMCDELQEGVLSLLAATPNNRDEAGASRDSMVFNPHFTNAQMFKFLGEFQMQHNKYLVRLICLFMLIWFCHLFYNK